MHSLLVTLFQHNPINGSGDVKQMVLGISVGVFGIVAARTIGALVKRHIDSVSTCCNFVIFLVLTYCTSQVETAGASSLRVILPPRAHAPPRNTFQSDATGAYAEVSVGL